MPRKDGFLREIAEKSIIKALNRRKIRKNAAISRKITANMKRLVFIKTLTTLLTLWRSR
jgi:hypothetical protein